MGESCGDEGADVGFVGCYCLGGRGRRGRRRGWGMAEEESEELHV